MKGLKNSTKVGIWSALALFASASLCMASGGQDGGGGGAYVCRNSDGTIKKAMLVDLWEAANTTIKWNHKTGKLHIPISNQVPGRDQFNAALEKLVKIDPQFAARVKEEAQAITFNQEMVTKGVSIALPDDLKVGYFPDGCPPEGMMYYDADTENLNIREDIYSKMESNTEFGAALMHEAIYKVMRDDQRHTSSKASRRLVACLFSDEVGCLSNPYEKEAEIPVDGRFVFRCAGGKFADVLLYPKDKLFDPGELNRPHDYHLVIKKMDGMELGYAPGFIASISSKSKGTSIPLRKGIPYVRGPLGSFDVLPVALQKFSINLDFITYMYDHFTLSVFSDGNIDNKQELKCKQIPIYELMSEDKINELIREENGKEKKSTKIESTIEGASGISTK
jgi:hypothetical protein